MTEAIISTLPMDPKRSNELFLFTTPFVAHLIAQATERNLVLPINRIGDASLVDDPFKQGLEALAIRPYSLVYDDDHNFLKSFQTTLQDEFKAGKLHLEDCPVFRCDCGAVEILEQATFKINKRTNGKTFSINDQGDIYCKKCQGETILKNQLCLLTTTCKYEGERVKVQPNLYAKQVQEELIGYCRNSHLVSRQRYTQIEVTIDGHQANIDNDYTWLHYGQYMQQQSQNLDAIVASNHSLRKGALYAYFLSMAAEDPINLFITPYVSFRNKDTNLATKNLWNDYSPAELRIFLTAYLNWMVQNSFADPQLLKWSQKVARGLGVKEHLVIGIEDATKIIRGHNLKEAVASSNKANILTEDQKAILSLVQA